MLFLTPMQTFKIMKMSANRHPNINHDSLARELVKLSERYSAQVIEKTLIKRILESNSVSFSKIKNPSVKTVVKSDLNTNQIEEWLDSHKISSVDIYLLEKFYELLVSAEDRKADGAYYTPTNIVRYIVNNVISKKGTVCDPSCGSGAFLIEATIHLHNKYSLSFKEIFKGYIFGVDLVPVNVERTKLILSLLAIVNGEDDNFRFNLYSGDSLTFDWKKINKGGFDFIVGNPPYVRTKNLRDDVRRNMRNWSTGSFGNVDLYVVFFEIALAIANEKGRIGYITPNTYLSSLNGKVLREIISQSRIVEEIVDFNGLQVFQGATTYTCITILDKQDGIKSVRIKLVDDYKDLDDISKVDTDHLPTSTLVTNDEWRILPKKHRENIEKIETAGTPLDKSVKRYITGLATLNNDLYLVEDTGGEILEKTYKGKRFLIERSATQKIIKPNVIKTKQGLTSNSERIIYPYKFDENSNSAKLIPEAELKKRFPQTYKYLSAHKDELRQRDGGKKKYGSWYAYGRTQGLNGFGEKIIMPMMGNRPSFLLVKDPNTLFYCGYALFPKNKKDVGILLKILNSEILWYYLKKTSKNYSGGYKSFAKNYIKRFSIPEFSDEEKLTLLKLEGEDLSAFLKEKYKLA